MTRSRAPHLVPFLRFPEFASEPGWELVPLNELATRVTERNIEGAELRALTNSAEFGVVDQRTYFKKEIANNTENYFVVDRGDYIYNPRTSISAPVGPISRNEIGKGVVSPLYTAFRFEHGSNDFFSHYFKSSKWHAYLRTVANSGARHDRMSIATSDLMRMPIPVPSQREQLKIAECLTSLEELIGQVDRSRSLSEQYKKGLMQQLFPAAGGSQPLLRFSQFRESSEWEWAELGEIAEVTLGKMLDRNRNTSGTLLSYLNNASVRWNSINASNLPTMYFSDDETERYELLAGDVVVCEGGEPGRSAIWDGSIHNVKFQKAIHRVRFNVPFEPQLLVFYLQSIAETSQFERLLTGGGIKHLTRESFLRLEVPLATLAEQRLVAGCLSSLDTFISLLGHRSQILREHRSGLLQQLFPAPEVDG